MSKKENTCFKRTRSIKITHYAVSSVSTVI